MKQLTLLVPIALILTFSQLTGQVLPEINILTPDGGEQFTGGNTISVIWTSTIPNLPVDIAYSCDEGVTWSTIAENVVGPRYLWHLPTLELGSTCQMRITASNQRSAEPQFVREFSGHNKNVNAVDIGPNGKNLVTGGTDGRLIMWDPWTGVEKWSVAAHSNPIILARFSPSGDRIVTGSMDGTAKVWDSKTGKILHNLAAHRGIVWPADFSADGKQV